MKTTLKLDKTIKYNLTVKKELLFQQKCWFIDKIDEPILMNIEIYVDDNKKIVGQGYLQISRIDGTGPLTIKKCKTKK
jgi:hypothetical protein